MSIDNGNTLQSISTLLDALGCGAALIDRSGKFAHVNRRMAEMMQLQCDQLVGRDIRDLYDDADAREALSNALAHFDQPIEKEFYLPLPDGGRLPVVYSSRQLSGEKPLSDHRIVTIFDISKEKEADRLRQEHFEYIVQISDTVLQQALELKHYSKELEQRVNERTADLHAANMDAVYMLAVAAEAKDQDTGRHVRRIQAYSRALALQLGMTDSEAENLGHSAILHDVGKLHVPDRILGKPGPLTDSEREEMKTHTIVGEKILSPREFFTQARQIARSHHENWSGSGYPDHLDGQRIPLPARVVHVADVYDALSNKRIYKDAWPAERAAEVIQEQAGKMFDPEIARAFCALLAETDLTKVPHSNDETGK